MKKKRFVGLFLAVLFAVTFVLGNTFAASEDELNAQKSAAEEARNAAQYQVDLTQNTIDGIATEIENANAAIAEIETQISSLDAQITETNKAIENLQEKVKKTQLERDQLQEELEARMRVMYMYGNEGYVEILFSSEDFGDLISKVEVVMTVISSDKQSLSNLEKIQNELEQEQAEIEVQKADLNAKKAEQQEKKQAQDTIKAQLNELKAQNQTILDEYAAEVAEQEAIIHEAEAGLAEIAAQKQAELVKQNGGSSNAGSATYIWPSDYYEITDYFGWRDQPCAGASTYHQGIDIGASYGSPIYACASGTVTLAEYYGGYGYTVMIAHADGYTTLYGHQSSLAVSEGEYVSQGQIIGYCGSTGTSTGPHIHLSFIDSSGDFVNPLNFL